MRVILTENTHYKDYWSSKRTETWLLIEDNGTPDGGAILAEFRETANALTFCGAMGWETVD